MKNRKPVKLWVSILFILSLLFSLFSAALTPLPAQAEETKVVLAGNLQHLFGGSDWAPDNYNTQMVDDGDGYYHFTGTLPKGEYEYKIALNGSWNENYGKGGVRGGENIKITVSEEREVTFYFNLNTHAIADTTTYTPLPNDQLPRLVGTIQLGIGEANAWDPAGATALMRDAYFDNKVYTVKVRVRKGAYEYKVVLGTSWDHPNYGLDGGSMNIPLNVLSDTTITFTFINNETHAIYTDYNPGGLDGLVDGSKLVHNTWDRLYRDPFGAIAVGQPVTLRLQAKKDDLSRARLVLKNLDTGSSKLLNMKKIGTATINGTEAELWEAVFTPEEKGVYGYKFIAGDLEVQKEYGEDAEQGSYGSPADTNANLFQLTVYDPSYHTPDWMKEAVVYQIFPDRFKNGNSGNDHAKDDVGARGAQPIEHRAWNQLPDNPNMKDSPGYDGDGEWSNDFFGGDIQGITDQLDYLQSLGVNALYLNPIATAASNHKYDAADWKSLDPMFGTPEEFQTFVDELKKRNMHLIMDGVFNHSGDDSIYFDRYGKYPTVGAYEYWSRIYDLMNQQGMTEDQAKQKAREELTAEGQTFSPYGFENWFNIENQKVDAGTPNERYKYQAWWGFDSLPEIKSVPGTEVDHNSELNNQSFANYIFRDADSVAKSWINRGASGWRLDVANEVDPSFWREFRKELKKVPTVLGDDPLILGEIWDDASKYFLGDQYDSVMNYRFRDALLSFLKNGNAANMEKGLTAIREDYPQEAFHALLNLLGSHDTARAIFLLGGGSEASPRAEMDSNYNYELGKKRLQLASIFQMGYPGAPTIYYGDEVGLTGSKDPDDRRTYPWGREDQELLSHYRKVGEIRASHAALFAHGEIETLRSDGDLYVYGRSYNNQYAIVAINRGTTDQTVQLDMKGKLINGIRLTDGLDPSYMVTSEENRITLSLPAMTGRMLISEDGQSLKAPSAITNLTAEEGVGSVTLHWSPSPEATSYKVYISSVKGALYQEVQNLSLNDTNAAITDLPNGRPLYFAVTAVDANGNESEMTQTDAVIPHFFWNEGSYWTSVVTVTSDTYIDLDREQIAQAEVWIDGATETALAEGFIAELQIKEPGSEEWISIPATYKGQSGNNNQFEASFTPYQEGVYQIRMAYSTDSGRYWVYTKETSKGMIKDPADPIPPAEEILLQQPIQESGQVQLNWSVTDNVYDENAGIDPIYYDGPKLYRVFRDGKAVAEVAGGSAEYLDYDVENGKTYSYFLRAYDRKGNYVDSNPVTVTPDLVMIAVTFKVHAPDYTPLETQINIPGSLNGWNTGAWGMSRNGATTTDWEYTAYIQDGTPITYKYVKGNSWDQEGLADHTPSNLSDDDISLYGYGAPGTDLSVVVTNQGGNRMVIQDRILRWIDRPLVITSPTEGTKVAEEKVKITGNAIKGGVLTINDQPVTVNEDMSFSHEVALQPGENSITLHVEPGSDVQGTIFQNNMDAVGKATKSILLHVTRLEGKPEEDQEAPTAPERLAVLSTTSTSVTLTWNPASDNVGVVGYEVYQGETPVAQETNTRVTIGSLTPGTTYTFTVKAKDGAGNLSLPSNPVTVTTLEEGSGGNGNGGSPSGNGGGKDQTIVSEADLVSQKGKERAIIRMDQGTTEVLLPASAAEILGDKALEIQSDPISITIPAKVLEAAKNLLTLDLIKDASISLKIKPISKQNAVKILQDAGSLLQATRITAASNLYELGLSVASKDGRTKDLPKFPEPIRITLLLSEEMNKELVGLYRIAEDGRLEYAGGHITGNRITADLLHFSRYGALNYEKSFSDVPSTHWADKAIKQMAAKQIVKGVSEKAFAPQAEVTRAQFTAMVVRALHLEAKGSNRFTDIDQNAWYAVEVAAASEAGIVLGRDGRIFAPDIPITREEIAAIILRAYRLIGGKADSQTDRTPFADQSDISPWAADDVREAFQLGLIQGRTNHRFAPLENATRAESTQMIFNLITLKEELEQGK